MAYAAIFVSCDLVLLHRGLWPSGVPQDTIGLPQPTPRGRKRRKCKMSVAWMIGAFALVLTPIIFIHELGHFVVARLFKIRVEEFGIGFPPRAVKLFERGGRSTR